MVKFLDVWRWMVNRSKTVYRWDKSLDVAIPRESDGLDYAGIATAMELADSGEIGPWLKFASEIEAKDVHLGAVARTRRLALTGVDWSFEPGEVSREEQQGVAMEATEFLRSILYDFPPFDRFLVHNSKAIGPNVSVTELVWEGGKLANLVPIPGNRLKIDYNLGPGIRVRTRTNHVGELAVIGKFIVHIPEFQEPNPFANTISRSMGKVWLMKNLAMADWATFLEIFGMPVRWGTYPDGTDAKSIDVIKKALASMGTLAYGVFPQGTDLQMKEAGARGTDPFQAMIEYLDKKLSIGWLGQNLTTETADTGARAMAQVHDQVRTDILFDDMRAEASTIREQLFKPLIDIGFHTLGAPLPVFVRTPKVSRDRSQDADVLIKAQQAGMAIDRKWAYAHLGIKQPEFTDDGKLVEPASVLTVPEAAAAVPFGGGAFSDRGP